MAILRCLMFVALLALGTAGCNNNPQTNKPGTAIDSPAAKIDTVDAGDDGSDSTCIDRFFANLPRFADSLSATLYLQNGKKVSLTQFFKDEFMSPLSEYGKKDIDGDGKLELIVFNYTGGAHCCDEFFIFNERSPTEYDFKAHLVGGHACIDPGSNAIIYSFSETLGYFFSCYACDFPDSSGTFKTLREIRLVYNHTKLTVVPYDSLAEKQNIKNLSLLQQNGFERIEGLMDNGWRKEYAMNLAIWYFNHRKDLKGTRRLFDLYYPFKDAPKVWNEFQSALRDMQKANTF